MHSGTPGTPSHGPDHPLLGILGVGWVLAGGWALWGRVGTCPPAGWGKGGSPWEPMPRGHRGAWHGQIHDRWWHWENLLCPMAGSSAPQSPAPCWGTHSPLGTAQPRRRGQDRWKLAGAGCGKHRHGT